MNILFVITRADAIGGAQVHVKDIAMALKKDRHKVLVLTGKQGIFNEDLRNADIESIPCEFLGKQINPFLDGKSLRYILYIISEFKPDLIAAHSSKTGILGRLASKISNVPCVFTAHGWSFTTGIPQPYRAIYRILEKATSSLAERIICVSEYDRTIGLEAGMNAQRLVTVHNGMKDINPNLLANPAKTETVKVAMVARFDRQKDHETLIKAFQGLDAELILIGDGPSMLKTQQQVEKLEMSKQVTFLGFRQDIAQILAKVQIFTLISNWEGLPCTIIEAMRAGLPVVASDVGGVKEIVADSQTGYVIPRGDVTTLRSKLAYLISNKSARASMGILARQKYEKELTFEHMYRQTLSVYEQAIADKPQVVTTK